jgi:hypothetical protein
MTRTVIALFLSLPLFTGCALFESKATRAMRASPDYKVGYGDGCASASTPSANPRADTRQRDEDAYAGNPAYRTGWGEGFGACRGVAQMRNNPIAGGGVGGLPMPPR